MRSSSSHLMPESVMTIFTLGSPIVRRQAMSTDMPEAFSAARGCATSGMNE